MRALVLRGSRNVFILRPLELNSETNPHEIECTLKGKKLKEVKGYYNPIAPGDIVETDAEQITGLIERKNSFARFNQKGQSVQLLAANVDYAICVTSAHSPPFRPRFIDRFLFQAELSGITPIILCNKADLLKNNHDELETRLKDFRRIGYTLLRVSALSGEGLNEFRSLINGKTVVLAGQSGVGKSTIINALNPGLIQKTGIINEKYQRGNHTTTQPVLLEISLKDDDDKKTAVIDTPGIRRFAPERVPVSDVIYYFREFASLAGLCGFGLSCTHETEKDCRIREAVENGTIHEDRYLSFLRLKDEMAGTDKYPDYD